MEIREVRRTEYEEAGRVTASAYREFVPPDAGQDWTEYLEMIADVRGRAGRTVVLVAVEEGRLLGSATLELDRPIGDEGDLQPETANLRMLGVDPTARARGAGRSLVATCVERARSAGKRSVTLHTTEPMVVARAMYERMGFTREPARDYRMPDGGMLLAYRLSLVSLA